MPTAKYFSKCAAFPSDVPVAQIPTLSYSKLQKGEQQESSRLFEACREHGFFILDLNYSSDGEVLLRDAEAMFDLTNETFDLGKERLAEYAYQPPKNLEGYKSSGQIKTDDGNLDAMEMYMIGQDDIFGRVPPRPKPDVIEKRTAECKEFFTHAHQTCSVILDALDGRLGLPKGTLKSLSPLDKDSATTIRLLRAQPAALVKDQYITLGGHNDIGNITLLFNVVAGLQILPAGSESTPENWRYIRPQQGCAIVNLGDTLVEWTGGVLRSSLHRVHNPPGEQKDIVRQSLAYLMRPARDGSMQRLQGSSVIPVLAEGEEDEMRSVDDWAAWRSKEIIMGRLKPQTRGGIPLSIDRAAQTLSQITV